MKVDVSDSNDFPFSIDSIESFFWQVNKPLIFCRGARQFSRPSLNFFVEASLRRSHGWKMYIKQIESEKVERLLGMAGKQARHSGQKKSTGIQLGEKLGVPVTSDQLFRRASCLITSTRLISKGSPCHGRPKSSASFDAHLSVLLHLLAHLHQIGLKKSDEVHSVF